MDEELSEAEQLNGLIEEVVDSVEELADRIDALSEKVDEHDATDIAERKKLYDALSRIEKLPGEPGYTPKKGIDYFDGQNGKTPKKGVDYVDGKTPTKKELLALIEPLIQKEEVDIDKLIKDLRKEIKPVVYEVIANNHHAGQASPDVRVNGTYVLTPYRDINLIAGPNISITTAPNNTTKFTEITITGTGSGGSGITRQVANQNTSTTAGNTPGVDYVYICAQGIALTLPTASGNSDLYTVKNTSASSVLVATTAAQTIDGQSTQILADKYVSIDLISDGSNWNII